MKYINVSPQLRPTVKIPAFSNPTLKMNLYDLEMLKAECRGESQKILIEVESLAKPI